MEENENPRRQLNDQWDILDALTLVSFMAQLQNMEEDAVEKDYIHKVIYAISDEIEKLHKENDIIISKLERLEKAVNNENN